MAEAPGVHASNATRTVDRLVVAGLIDRRDSPADRRQLELTLTSKGRDLVESVMSHRRAWPERCCSACRPAVDAP
ncbi:MAG: MarR family transcriptional regulator [Geodermatophilaceae bacterium]